MLRFVLMCCLTLLSAASWAQGPLVVSTHPLYLIAQKITAGVEEPQLLLSNQSGHDVQLTPAHRKAIQDASLVIWLGKAHEAPLAKLLDNNAKAVSIINSQIGTSLPQRTTRGVPIANTIDTHVWLDPNNAVRIGFFIAALRSQQMPENKTKYWNNARLFARDMLQAAQKYNSTAAPKPYWSYHDAYQYLERSLNLKFAGALTDDPHVAPTVGQIKYLNDNRPSERMCLMAEAHASKNQYQKLSPIVFESVDESLTGENDFVVAWQKLASQTVKCVQTASK
ncbi:metal ABC transporter solute-binding protein, Zn/Mn family [Acinetobacter soli]|uniref:High-affinity zinc uptake system protein ZnuA n=1 Tax=Acinetobacter soli TaxID=487316 RepID=A0AB38YYG0_9GAMM|nr:zinc ABC transporter substrate-binding protein [Acinetobacter soli]MDQ9833031.1 zinc ABC transporter substrate-binding protein [Acinetobacter soli]RSB51047.1 zinc ABC transporter substrate-binding protein [Acinetobacter soli]WND06244.1 zinc ABC transporter substrate-binding protein [Acinetobacter soli]